MICDKEKAFFICRLHFFKINFNISTKQIEKKNFSGVFAWSSCFFGKPFLGCSAKDRRPFCVQNLAVEASSCYKIQQFVEYLLMFIQQHLMESISVLLLGTRWGRGNIPHLRWGYVCFSIKLLVAVYSSLLEIEMHQPCVHDVCAHDYPHAIPSLLDFSKGVWICLWWRWKSTSLFFKSRWWRRSLSPSRPLASSVEKIKF